MKKTTENNQPDGNTKVKISYDPSDLSRVFDEKGEKIESGLIQMHSRGLMATDRDVLKEMLQDTGLKNCVRIPGKSA